MKAGVAKRIVATMLVALFGLHAGVVIGRFPDVGPTPTAPVTPDGYVPVADLLQVLSASWEWDPVLGRLVIILQSEERLVLLVDSRIVGLGDRLFRLKDPVRFINGRLLVPESLVTDVLEQVLGHRIELRTPTPERPTSWPTPGGEFGPVSWSQSLREDAESKSTGPFGEHERRTGERPIIVLDPGHGGDDRGSVGVGSTTESEVVLRIAELCEASLETAFDVDVRLTRRDDRNLATVDRIAYANGLAAQVFVSLHAGSLFDSKRNIPSVFFQAVPTETKEPTRSAVQWWNEPSVQSRFIEWSRGAASWARESGSLANDLHDALRASWEGNESSSLDGPRPARLAILRGLLMPGVLVELGGLSSLETEQVFNQAGFSHRLAESLAHAIGSWLYRQQGRSPGETLVP